MFIRVGLPRLLVLALGLTLLFAFAGCGGGSGGGGVTGGGGGSGPTSNAVPVVSSISPTSVTVSGVPVTLTANGYDFVATSQIEWNNVALATTYVSSSQLTAQIPASSLSAAGFAQVTVTSPAPGGGQSGSYLFSIISGATQVKVIPVNANDIVWDATRGKIYASLPSSDGASGNSVVTIDPVAGTVGTSQTAGSEPNQLAISSDASYLWVGEDGSSAVQRFKLPGLTPDITIALPNFAPGIGEAALSLQAAPVSPHTVAVLVGVPSDEPPAMDTVIYDDATQRPTTADSFAFDSIQWGADDTQLYSEDFIDLDNFTTMSVNASGATIVNSYPDVYLGPFVGRGHYDAQTGYVFADNGFVVNPVTGDIVGSANLSSLIEYYLSPMILGGWGDYDAPKDVYPRCVPDPVQPVLFCLGLNENGYAIQAFDKTTFQPLNTLAIPQATGKALNLIRWGNSGLAFNTVPSVLTTSSPGSIYLVDGSFVNSSLPPDSTNGTGVAMEPVLTSISPQFAAAGSASVTITVTGRNFLPGAVVNWLALNQEGTIFPLSTVYVSATELQATVPASFLAATGYGSISVINAASQNVTPQDIALFTVTPSSGGIMALNLASYDVAWDKLSGLLYAAVWDADPQYPNSIVAINPNTGQVVNSQFAGTDPYIVRTTTDGAYVYTASFINDTVTRFQLPGLTSPLAWSTRVNSLANQWIPLDLEPAPGASATIAVALGSYGASPEGEGGITIFDNNVARPTRANGWTGTTGVGPSGDYVSLQWGSNSSTLYGGDVVDFRTLDVNSSGVSPLNDYPQTTPYAPFQPKSYLHFDPGTGTIYNDDAQAINPANGNVIGTFNPSNLSLSNSVTGFVVPDSSLNRIFLLSQTTAQAALGDSFTIQSFNETTFAPVNSITISNIEGTPQAFIRWGNSGLALVTYIRNTASYPSGMLYIINNPSFVNAN
jgi:hypothetical protein